MRKPSNRRQRGLTLIELLLVLTIISLLAVFALPRILDVRENARQAAEDDVVGSVRGGIMIYLSQSLLIGRLPRYPEELDTAAPGNASPANPFFSVLLDPPIMGVWIKGGGGDYTGPANGTYRYDPADGSFVKLGEGS